MSLEDWSAIAQIASGIAVIASLIFVGIQIRQNTLATRAQIRENIMSDWTSMGQLLMTNPRVFAIGLSGSDDDYNSLSDTDKITFMTQALVIFKHYENMFLQYDAGFLSKENWDAWSTHAVMYFNQRGIQNWWRARRIAFTPKFREFLETAGPSQMVTQAELFTRKPNSTAAAGPAAASA